MYFLFQTVSSFYLVSFFLHETVTDIINFLRNCTAVFIVRSLTSVFFTLLTFLRLCYSVYD